LDGVGASKDTRIDSRPRQDKLHEDPLGLLRSTHATMPIPRRGVFWAKVFHIE